MKKINFKTKLFAIKACIAVFILLLAKDFINQIPEAIDGTKYAQLIEESAMPEKFLAYSIGIAMIIYGALLIWSVYFVIKVVIGFIKATQEEYGEA